MTPADLQFMQRCLDLAALGKYSARPNPMVGGIVVRDNMVVGEGWHVKAGLDHGEIVALKNAGGRAAGATLYVNLEPCDHTGRTGPCSKAVIAAGIRRVVFGMIDPNPVVAGKGVARLRDAGIVVDGPLLEPQCLALNAGFDKRMRTGLPYVRCKMAMSLDGRTAMASGESQWITGPQARDDVQRLRAMSGAVMTGIETVLKDDPGLDVRLPDIACEQPLRVIVDSRLRLPASAKTLQQAGAVLIATAVTRPDLVAHKQAELPANTTIYSCANAQGRVDLPALLHFLAQEKHCNDVLLETGAELAGAMLQAGLVDEVITYVAPKLLGSDARPLFNLRGIESLADHVQLELCDVAMLGKDCRMRSRVKVTD